MSKSNGYTVNNVYKGRKNKKFKSKFKNNEIKPVIKSRDESLPYAQAVKSDSRANGMASNNSHAGSKGLCEGSPAVGGDPCTQLLDDDELPDEGTLVIFE